jgi:dynein heavy chain 1
VLSFPFARSPLLPLSLLFRQTREACCDVLEPFLGPDGVIVSVLEYALEPARRHIMAASRGRLVVAFFSLLARGIGNVVQYNDSHPDFPLQASVVERFMDKWLVTSMVWGFGGSMDLTGRRDLCAYIATKHTVVLPALGSSATSKSAAASVDGELCAMDYFVSVQTGQWSLWQELVPTTDVPSHKVLETDAVIPTVDTVRHVVRTVLPEWAFRPWPAPLTRFPHARVGCCRRRLVVVRLTSCVVPACVCRIWLS